MHGWMVYIHKERTGRVVVGGCIPGARVSLAYDMLEILVDDDAGTCLMMQLVGRRWEGKGRVGCRKELEGREQIT